MSAAPNQGVATAPSYRFTFGHYLNTSWPDVRNLTWSELVALLTRHKVGPKEGSCIVPAVFRGTLRRKMDAERIDVAFLDSDAGATLDEIRSAITARGWAAIISSTHSHLTTRTEVKRTEWERFQATLGAAASAEALLLQEKGYRSEVAAGATIAEQRGEQVLITHAPCPKFRIAVPLQRPWLARSYASQDEANAAWKGCVEALAAALGLDHDQACTDTSRLFYLPRRPADGPWPETAVLEGQSCDILALPQPVPDRLDAGQGPTRRRQRNDTGSYVDPAGGEVFDLRTWARDYGSRFLIAKALRARRPIVLHARVADGVRHHLRCPNETAHTQLGEDNATFVMDAGSSQSGGFVIHCRHAHCDGQDRLFLLRRMLEQGWLSPQDLTHPELLIRTRHVPHWPSCYG
jgi:hypothetical protein